MSANQSRVRQLATAVAVVGAVIGVVAIVRAASSEDRSIGVSDESFADTSAAPGSTSSADELNDALAEQVNSTTAATSSAPPAGQGLQAEYFNGRGFTGAVVPAVDADLDLAWGAAAPAEGIPAQSFAVRWRGQLTSATTGEHQFSLKATGRVSLWVNGYAVIRGWDDNPTAERTGSTYLQADKPVDILVEFSADPTLGDTSLQLAWQPPGGEPAPIPTSAFTPLNADSARTIYASPSGSTENDGATPETAVSLQRAANLSRPGDTVMLLGGTYSQPSEGNSVMKVQRSGSPDLPITFTAAPDAQPVLASAEARGIEVSGACYITISGLTLEGAADTITQEQADAQLARDANNSFQTIPGAIANGILVNQRFDAKDVIPHHVTVANNSVSKFGGCGICSTSADHLLIDGNVVTNNGRWSIYSQPAINIEFSASSDGSTDTTIVIRNNQVSDNESRVVNPYSNDDPAKQLITGGSGIGVRDGRREERDDGSGVAPHSGRVRVENNVVDNNSGFGLSIRSTDRVDVVNNTFVENAAIDSEYISAELEIENSDDVVLLNNLIVARQGDYVARTVKATNVTVRTSLVVGTDQWGDLIPPTTLITEAPQFNGSDSGDYRLGPESPAIDAGEADGAPATDHLGTPRPAGAGFDLGAYESG